MAVHAYQASRFLKHLGPVRDHHVLCVAAALLPVLSNG